MRSSLSQGASMLQVWSKAVLYFASIVLTEFKIHGRINRRTAQKNVMPSATLQALNHTRSFNNTHSVSKT